MKVEFTLSTLNRCHVFQVNSSFITDEISTKFWRGISMSNRWRIDEDMSIGNVVLNHQHWIPSSTSTIPSTMHSNINPASLCQQWPTSSTLQYIINAVLNRQRCITLSRTHYTIKDNLHYQSCFAPATLLCIVKASSHCQCCIKKRVGASLNSIAQFKIVE